MIIVFLAFNNKNKLSATDILANANFNVENPTVTVHTIDSEKMICTRRLKLQNKYNKNF